MDVAAHARLCNIKDNCVIAKTKWDDSDFLVFMDAYVGPQAPSGDFRLMVHTGMGRRQMAVFQCNNSGRRSAKHSDRLASLQQVKKKLQTLRDCVQSLVVSITITVHSQSHMCSLGQDLRGSCTTCVCLWAPCLTITVRHYLQTFPVHASF